MILQNKYGTIREVKKSGCYLACIINAWILQTGKNDYGQLDLNETYYTALDEKLIETDCYINNAVRLCREILGWRIKDVIKVADQNYQKGNNGIAILLMKRYAPISPEAEADGYVYHFVLETKNGIIDPIQHGSVTAKSGAVHTKRIIILSEESVV